MHPVPQVLADVDRERLSEEESFRVCVQINGTRLHDITVSLKTFDGSALGIYIICNACRYIPH